MMKFHMCTSICGPYDRNDKQLVLEADGISYYSTCLLHAYYVICEKNTHLKESFDHTTSQSTYIWRSHHILLVSPPKKSVVQCEYLNYSYIKKNHSNAFIILDKSFVHSYSDPSFKLGGIIQQWEPHG